MKLTKSKLKQLIKEELRKMLTEGEADLCGDDGNCQQVCGIYDACVESGGQQLGGCELHESLSQAMSRGEVATPTMNLEAWHQDCKTRIDRLTRQGKVSAGGIRQSQG